MFVFGRVGVVPTLPYSEAAMILDALMTEGSGDHKGCSKVEVKDIEGIRFTVGGQTYEAQDRNGTLRLSAINSPRGFSIKGVSSAIMDITAG